MDNPVRVCMLQGLGYGLADFRDLSGGWFGAAQPIRERDAAHQIADDKNGIVFLADFVHRDDVRMLQLRCGARFAEEVIDFLRLQISFAGYFERDETV